MMALYFYLQNRRYSLPFFIVIGTVSIRACPLVHPSLLSSPPLPLQVSILDMLTKL